MHQSPYEKIKYELKIDELLHTDKHLSELPDKDEDEIFFQHGNTLINVKTLNLFRISYQQLLRG